MIFSVEKNMVVLSSFYIEYIYTICMKFISFFNDIILIQLRRKDIFSSDTKKYPNRLEFSLIT